MNNPYSAPNAVLADPASDDEFYQPRVFSVRGRIGRLRYLAYSFSLLAVFTAAAGILAAVLMPSFARGDGAGVGAMMLLGLIYIPVIAVTLIMAKRRLNDLDRSGWLSLLMLVPFINLFCFLYLTFGPGSSETNQYGPRPAQNSTLVIIASLALPIVFVAGTLAAIAIPAYLQYKARAVQSAVPASFTIASNRSGFSV